MYAFESSAWVPSSFCTAKMTCGGPGESVVGAVHSNDPASDRDTAVHGCPPSEAIKLARKPSPVTRRVTGPEAGP